MIYKDIGLEYQELFHEVFKKRHSTYVTKVLIMETANPYKPFSARVRCWYGAEDEPRGTYKFDVEAETLDLLMAKLDRELALLKLQTLDE